MGKDNKLLLPYNGKTVIATVVENILNAGLEEVIVVTGHEEEKLRMALQDMTVLFAPNPRYLTGMTSSIQEGIRKAQGKGYMICLSDMVLINSRMSSVRQAVHRADNFIGFGNRPDFTPSHQQVLPTG